MVLRRVWKNIVLTTTLFPSLFVSRCRIVIARSLSWLGRSWDNNDLTGISDHVSWASLVLYSWHRQSVVFRMSSFDSLLLIFDSSSVNVLGCDSDGAVAEIVVGFGRIEMFKIFRGS